MNQRNQNLSKSPEIELLIQPLTETEYSVLEENLSVNGCIEPIIIWNNTIIDGHKRYDICCRQNLPFSTYSILFKEIYDAIAYVCKLQLRRQDLTLEYRKYLLGRLFQAEVKLAARDYLLSSSRNQKKQENSFSSPPNKYATARRIGKDFYISYATVIKYSTYTNCLDCINARENSLFQQILMGKLKTSHENVIEISRLPKEDLMRIKTILEESSTERICYSKMRDKLHWKKKRSLPQMKKPKPSPAIRKMPRFDPDANISSLTLTIPSWISSIERSHNNTDFSMVSSAACSELIHQLSLLKRAVTKIENSIMEEK